MLFDLLERHAADRPDHLAIVCGDERLTWGQLDDRASRLASGLAALGVGPNDTVALLLPNSTALVSAILALSRIGAQALPLQPDLKAPEIRHALEAAGCSMTLERPSVNRLVAESPTSRRGSVADDAPFLNLLTAGTTGSPRRVVRTQKALCALASAYCETTGLTDADRTLCVIPLHHGHGLCAGLLAPLCSGSTLFLELGFERRATLRLLSEHAITAFSAPPFIFSIVAESAVREPLTRPELRLPFTSGAPLHRDAWRKVRDRLGIGLRQCYGASETGVVAMNMDADPEASAASVGRPLSGVEVSIGAAGEIAVRSPWTATWSAPLERGAALTPLADEGGWIHLADIGHVDATGRLYLTGRTSRFINIAGRKVSPLEVEAVLATHPLVTGVTVVPVRDGQGNEAAKAVVYASGPLPSEALAEFCRERLAPHKVPRFIEIRDETDRSK
jgi:long-chain acyl-CoA synthetase